MTRRINAPKKQIILGSIMKRKLKQQQKLVGKNLKENVQNSKKTGRLHMNNREDSNSWSNNHIPRRSQYCTGIKSGQINLPKNKSRNTLPRGHNP